MSSMWNSKTALKNTTRLTPVDAVLLLEDRILMDAEASVTIISAPGTISPGSDFSIVARFDNVPDGDPGSTTGYGPYLDVYVPVGGRDGNDPDAGPDGVDFLGATFAGGPLAVSQTLTFSTDSDGDGKLDVLHPYFVDTAGNPLKINVTGAQVGDKLVVLQLPFGSFTQDQTPADITLNFRTSPLADVNTNIAIDLQGGFRFGRDALNNPATDPSLLSPVVSATLGVSGATLSTIYNGPNNDSNIGDDNSTNASGQETATGPNYEQTYTIRMSIPTGQNVSILHLQDLLPDTIVYRGVDAITVNGVAFTPGQITTAVIDQPALNTVVNPADNLLDVNLGSITGTAATYDVEVVVRFYVNNVKFDGTPVINPFSANTTETTNNVRATGNYNPADPLDPANVAFAIEAALENVSGGNIRDNVIDNEAIAVQKTAVLVTDNNAAGLSSGDIVEYTIDIQISDYFTFGDIILSDLLGDGQRILGSFTPTFQVVENGVNTGITAFAGLAVGTAARGFGPESATTLSGGNFTAVYDSATGITQSTITLSQELITRGLVGGDGVLAGDIARDATAGGGATTIRVTFRAEVLQFYDANGLSVADRPVNQGDAVGNRVSVTGSVRDNATPALIKQVGGVNQFESDDAQAGLVAPVGAVSKSIEYINGAAPIVDPVLGTVVAHAGDTITYRVNYALPLTRAENFTITDFLPLPIFDAAEFAGAVLDFNEIAGDPAPAAGTVRVAFSDTFTSVWDALPGTTAPSLVIDATNNSFRINFGTFESQPAQATTLSILFTVTIRDLPFADGLNITNQVAGSEGATQGATTTTPALAPILLTAPDVLISKGVVATTHGTLSGAPANAFTAPGSAGARFSGTYTDANISSLNTNITGIDANDTLTFAIVLNNDGTSPNGAFDVSVTDTVPTGFVVPASIAGLNIAVHRGNGTLLTAVIDYTTTYNAGTGQFTVTLVDPSSTQGALARDNAANGADIIIITYDAKTLATTAPAQLFTNTATLTNFAAQNNGTDITATYDASGALLLQADRTDIATAQANQPAVAKALLTTTDTNTTGSNLAVGETATFRLTYIFREGTSTAVTLSDVLPVGFTYVSSNYVSLGSDLSETGAAAIGSGGVYTAGDNTVRFDFGTVNNSGTNNVYDANDQIVIDVVAQYTGAAANNTVLQNTANFLASGISGSAQAAVTIVVPALSTTKSVDTDVVAAGVQNAPRQAGDTVEYTIVIANPAGAAASAYDVAVNDLIPANLTFVAGSLSVTQTGNPVASIAFASGPNRITGSVDQLDAGESITITFRATVNSNALASSTITNTANIDYTTQPGVVSGERTISQAPAAGFDIAPPVLDKTIVNTSVGNDTSTSVVHGEVITYQITFALPDSAINAVVLQDALNPGFIYVSSRVLAIGSDIAGSGLALNAAGTFTGGTNTVDFNFGNLTNAQGGSVAANSITVEVQVLVDPSFSGPVNGAVIGNNGLLSYNNGAGTVTATDPSPPSVNVIEPELQIVKTVLSGSVADAGDIVTYQIVVSHLASSTAAARDLIISDALGGGIGAAFTLIVGTVTTSAGTVTTGNGGGDIAIAIDVGTLALGDTITVTYQARVNDNANLGARYDNNGVINYDSITGVNPDPDGAGPLQPQDGRNKVNSSLASFDVSNAVTIAKSIFNTSVGNDTSSNVVIGEVITYRIRVVLPEGTTNSLVISDLAEISPQFLRLIDASVVSVGSGSSITTSLTGTPTVNTSTGVTTFDFGSVVNKGNNISTGNDNAIIVEVRALVIDTPANTRGSVLTNAANVVFTNNGSPATVVAADINVTLREPQLALTKVIDANLVLPGNQTTAVDAGDTVRFTLTINHTAASNSDAFDVTVSDLIDPRYALVAGSVVITGGVGTATAGSYSSLNGTPLSVDFATIAQGSTVTITFDAVVRDSAEFGTTIPNSATVVFDSLSGTNSDPDGAGPLTAQPGRAGSAAAPSGVGTSAPIASGVTIAKSIFNTSVGNDASSNVVIGEVITYRLRIVLPEGTTNSLIISDLAEISPQFLRLIDASVVSLGTAGSITTTLSGTPALNAATGLVTFDFGSVVNAGNNISLGDDNAIIVEVRALVIDVPANARGSVLTNTAQVAFTSNGVTQTVAAPNVDIAVREPELQITKAIDTNLIAPGNQATAVDAGDTVRFTLTITHTASSNSDAFDVVVSDLIDPRYQLVAGSVVISGAAGAATPGAYSAITGTPLSVDFATIAQGSTVTITFDAVVQDTAALGATIPNSASVTFDSIAGTNADPDGAGPLAAQPGRAGSATAVASAASSAPISSAVSISKSIFTTSVGNDTSANVQIGELITYRIVLTLPEGTLPNLVIRDLMEFGADQLQFVSGRVVASTETGGSGIAVLPTPTITVSNVDGLGPDDAVAFDFGSIINPGDNITTNNTVVIEVVARVIDVPANTRNDTLRNTANAQFTINGLAQTVNAAPVDVIIVEPALQVNKVADVISAKPGDIITYTVTVTHTAASNATAYDIRVADALPPQFQLLGAPIIVSNPGGVTIGGTGVDVSISDLDVGETLVISYQVRVIGSPPAGTTVANNASVNWDSLPGVGDLGRAPATPPGATALVGLVGFDKILVSTSLPETGASQFRPGVTDLSVGETVTWDLVVTVPNGNTTVKVTDFLPKGAGGVLQLVGLPVITNGAGVTTSLPGTLVGQDTDGDGINDEYVWDFGTVSNATLGQSTITIRVTALVVDVPANSAGGQLLSPATLDYGSGTISDSESFDIVAPALNIVKDVNVTTGDAGDILSYTVTISHQPGSTAAAYDLVISDLLDGDEELVPGSVVISGSGAPGAAVGAGVSVSDASLALGEQLIITYQTRIRDGVTGGSTVQSNATLAFDSAAGPGGRLGTAPTSVLADDALVTVPVATTLTKTIIATSDPLTASNQFVAANPDLNIGEAVTFEIRYTLNEVLLNGLILTDTLVTPTGVLTLAGTPTITFGAGVTGTAPTPQLVDTDGDGVPDRLVFNFGTVSNIGDNNPATGEIIIRYTAVAANVAANTAGDQLDLPVTASYVPFSGNAVTQTNAGPSVDIVVPALNIVKDVNVTTGDACDILSYTVTISHQPGSTAAAYDLVISDLLDGDEELVPGSVVISGSGAPGAAVGAGVSVSDASLALGEQLIITYQTRIRDGVTGGSIVQSNATLAFDSAAGPGGRLGTAPTSVLADDALVTVPVATTLTKTIIATSDPDTASNQHRPALPDLVIGETATFEVRFTLNEIRLNGLVINDTLVTPAGVLSLLGVPTVILGTGITGTAPTPVLVDTNGDGVPDLLRFDFGTVSNLGDNNPATGEIVIRYTAVVANVPANTNGDQLDLPVSASYAGLDGVTKTLAVTGPSIDIVEPVLQITTTIDKPAISNGETAYITITVVHTGASTANASDLSIASQIPPGLVPTGPVQLLGVPAGTSVNGLTVTSPTLTLGQVLTYRIPVTVTADANPLLPLTPVATLTYDSAAGSALVGRPGTGTASANLFVLVSGSAPMDRPIATYATSASSADRASYFRLPRLDPIFSGAADPGATVNLTLTGANGGAAGSATVLADAGGNWLAILPSVTAFDLLEHDRLQDYFDSTRLFDNFTGLFAQSSLLGFRQDIGGATFGSNLPDTVYNLTVASSSAVYNAADESPFNARTYFGPAWRNELFGSEAPLSIGKVFRDRAQYSVESLYAAAEHPLALGINKYNAEFLASSGLAASTR